MCTPIIDVHAHTTDKMLWELHVKTANIADLEKWAEEYRIAKIILMATYFPFKKSGLSNYELLKRINGNPLFSFCASLDISNGLAKGLKEIEVLAKNKQIIGIKLYPGYQELNPGSKGIFPIYELAEEYDLPVIFHAGELHHCCSKKLQNDLRENDCSMPCGYVFCKLDHLQKYARPEAMQEAIRKFSHVRFVVSHLGNPYFDELLRIMTYHSNVYTDISGQFISESSEDTPEYRNELKEVLTKLLELPGGENQLMFGTDFPIQSYQDSIDLVEMLGLSEEQKQKIYYKNAENVFSLTV